MLHAFRLLCIALLALFTLATLPGCSSGSGEPPKWPTPAELLECAPPAPALLEAAARALLATDAAERQAALEDLAAEHGPGALACALSRLAAAQSRPGVMSAESTGGASPVAAARARAFLACVAASQEPAAASDAAPTSHHQTGVPGAAGGNSK